MTTKMDKKQKVYRTRTKHDWSIMFVLGMAAAGFGGWTILEKDIVFRIVANVLSLAFQLLIFYALMHQVSDEVEEEIGYVKTK